jgi:CheY-like chemotaxis protein
MAGKVLMIIKHEKKIVQELSSLFNKNNLILAIEHDQGAAINRAQNAQFDVIVLDANIKGMPTEQMIQILRGIDPGVKIIVKTNENSKELEAKVRREKIYYYHLDSFGIDDLELAIKSALSKSINFFLPRDEARNKTEKYRRILMVDENDDFIEIHRANLENHHFEVKVCYNADEAFARIKSEVPDLILVDMDIQVGSDGLHFVEKIIDDEKIRKIPVLLFISKMRLSDDAELMEKIKSTLPTWSYLQKPVKIEDIIPKVNELLLSLRGALC